jgi:hypothetical protein
MKIIKATDKNKKWMAVFDYEDGKQKKVQFGSAGMDDYTITGDKKQRERYRKRHEKDLKTEDSTKPGYLSYYILWGNSKNIKTNINNYKKMFGYK